ncbi:XRE family transcriptional regulator [Lactococcus garvieae]|uniref:Putative repressor-phage associated n=1 Tax=Lactococcus garvieae DCC43 TaxID=1231377 RepID=K2QF30_9LACT|nr:XRE family transcriptional regulator [Lactococcus garvieae]EKF52022.1 putative repressor - phage associated [Lactococcus garvieae DCC43]
METNYFATNLKYLRQKYNMEQLELANRLGRKSSSSISEWEKGRYTPKAGILNDISEIFNIPLSQLMNEDLTSSNETTLDKINKISSLLKEPRRQAVLNIAREQLTEQQRENIINIREFTYNYYDNAVSAGTGQYLTDGIQETITLPVDYDADFVVPVCGDSMEPIYHDWDYVFVETTYDLYDGDIGVFILDGDAYIKELRIDEEGAFLHSLNPKYRDKPILPESDFRIVGKVIGRYNEKDKEEDN